MYVCICPCMSDDPGREAWLAKCGLSGGGGGGGWGAPGSAGGTSRHACYCNFAAAACNSERCSCSDDIRLRVFLWTLGRKTFFGRETIVTSNRRKMTCAPQGGQAYSIGALRAVMSTFLVFGLSYGLSDNKP